MLKKILVIDDEQSWLTIMNMMLSRLGHDVVVTNSAHAGINELKTKDFDIIFLDLMMPEMNGVDFLEELKKEKIPLSPKIILQTGSIDEKEINKAIELGVVEVLRKPYERADIVQVIERLSNLTHNDL